MRLPEVRRLNREDFPKQKDWIGKLLEPLNQFMRTVHQILNKGITIADNMDAYIKEMTFTKLSTYPSSDTPLLFRNDLSGYRAPQGVLLLSISESVSNPSVLTDAVTFDWSYDGTNIEINNITGLTNETKYKAKFLILGG